MSIKENNDKEFLFPTHPILGRLLVLVLVIIIVVARVHAVDGVLSIGFARFRATRVAGALFALALDGQLEAVLN